ncbi:MAG: DUF2182 domain-containing protein [Sphaerobacter thermophilus]|uniref:DUF2182 domain-containing protein n=1 Tax=Sphaerobacter thermophilus TaxID=2057 RepID=UPI000DB366CE|nr:MAG: metal-binding protein [Sphaerobacter thermophilus]
MQLRATIARPAFVAEALAVLAWLLFLGAILTGRDRVLSHDALLEGSTAPFWLTLLAFLAAWQLMTGAMMLPSSLPMMRLFARTSRGQAHPSLVLGIFLAAYFAVWTGFAAVALGADAGLHWLIDRWDWLAARPWLISGSVLLVAGAFQFSSLKEHCLHECRTPFTFLRQHYQRGLGPAWTLGVRHGLSCLGCCWALMLVMFAVGVGNIVWMVGLTGIMVAEKTTRWGRRLVPVVGITLLVWGLVVVLRPAWGILFLP